MAFNKNEILKWVKYLGYFILGVTGLIFLVWLFSFLGSYIKTKFNLKNDNTELDTVKDEVKELETKGMKGNYKQSWYDDQAAQFFENFKNRFMESGGKDDIRPVMLRLMNYPDYLLFKKAFGIRSWLTYKYTLSEFVVSKFGWEGEAFYNGYVRGLLLASSKK